MVSTKSLALLTLSVAAVAAVPHYPHAHLHHRAAPAGIALPAPAVAPTQDQQINDTEDALVKGPARRWTRTRTVYQPQNTPAPTASADSFVAATAGLEGGAGTATASADATNSTDIATGVSTGGKKGLSYNKNALLNQFSSAGASWAYNWAAGPGGAVPAGVEFVPMLWGRDGVGAWAGAVKTAIAGGSSHVLSFNEPDFPEQANIPAAEAARLHIANVANLHGQIKVGSPAITNSNIAGQGIDWMTEFLKHCGGASNNCKLDFLAFHWYNNPGTFENFKSHVNQVVKLAADNGVSKVWLTEFAVNGGAADQAAFVKQAIPWLDSQPAVERYAYFMVGEGQMLSGSSLNAVGKAYVS